MEPHQVTHSRESILYTGNSGFSWEVQLLNTWAPRHSGLVSLWKVLSLHVYKGCHDPLFIMKMCMFNLYIIQFAYERKIFVFSWLSEERVIFFPKLKL